MALGFQYGAFQSVGFQDEPSAAVVVTEPGSGLDFRPPRVRKRPIRIRRSEYATQEDYVAAVAAALAARTIPMDRVPDPRLPVFAGVEDDDDEDAILQALVLTVLNQ